MFFQHYQNIDIDLHTFVVDIQQCDFKLSGRSLVNSPSWKPEGKKKRLEGCLSRWLAPSEWYVVVHITIQKRGTLCHVALQADRMRRLSPSRTVWDWCLATRQKRIRLGCQRDFRVLPCAYVCVCVGETEYVSGCEHMWVVWVWCHLHADHDDPFLPSWDSH